MECFHSIMLLSEQIDIYTSIWFNRSTMGSHFFVCKDESVFSTRRTWLILPVVICLFQGLSHANVRVLVLRYRGVCVRLIKRFIIYPTKEGLVPFQRDNCANCAANTWEKIPRSLHHKFWVTETYGISEAVGRNKD